MNGPQENLKVLAELGPECAYAYMALLRVSLAVAEATPGCVGKAKHIILDHLAEMSPDERGGLYARLLGVAVNMADADVRGA